MAKKKRVAGTKAVPKSIRIDLTGHEYGRLTVLGFAGYRDDAPMWRCKCDCGTSSDYYRANLRSGTSTQCLECSRRQTGERSTTHGMWGTVEYRAWERIRKHDDVCRRWEKFENFYKDVGNRPSKSHIMVRKDTTGPWRPSNAGWAPRKNSGARRSNSNVIRFRGKSKTITEWAGEVGITAASLRSRLKSGWTVKEALTTKSMR